MLVESPKTRILKAIMKFLTCGKNAILQSFFPEVTDLGSVKEKNIRAVLPEYPRNVNRLVFKDLL